MNSRNIVKTTIILSIYLLALYCKNTTCLQQQQQQQQRQNQAPSSGQEKIITTRDNGQIRFDLPSCTLGNDTYQLGERWNPNLPPFGVQVCVQCECVVKNRKDCYEAKVACRRITNECPIIESCPDGKKPVTSVGQCCKSCQSASGSPDGPPLAHIPDEPASASRQPSPTAAAFISHEPPQQSPVSGQSEHNERIKNYQVEIKNLPACLKRDVGEKHVPTNPLKTSKGNKHELNGIEPRIAFKSLQGSPNLASSNPVTLRGRQETSADKPIDDTLRHDHQHPNDVQSWSLSNQVQQTVLLTRPGQSFLTPSQSVSINTNNKRPPSTSLDSPTTLMPFLSSAAPINMANTCILGSEAFQVGESWNPILPPFGVQVCVKCNCIVQTVKRRKRCYEARVTCRRIHNECPIIDSCPNGKKPITVAGQCCKMCPNGRANLLESGGGIAMPELRTNQRDEDIIKDNQLIMANYSPCSKRDAGNGNAKLTNASPVRRENP